MNFIICYVEKQKGTHYDHMRSLDKMIQIVKPYADQENNGEGVLPDELFT